MEHENTTQKSPYAFLSNPSVQRYFADLNIDLLQGKHITADDYYSYQLLREYYEPELKQYYKELYELILEKATFDNSTYFYLDFPVDSKGRLSNRSRELSEQQVIIGIILLKMYYDMYFKYPKELFWEDIKEEIEQSELKDLYKKLFFEEVRDFYTDKEWEKVQELFRRTINSFTQLGWIKKLSKGKEDIHFQLKESIHRFAELYKYEIEEFPQFVSKIKLF
ncbi:chromosome partition protein MukE [uncultured Bacteroides sp.]|uniref:chromosome partition protein MukE n=1 Tax=uncultured Bacteroides sp. TaxID=162156 RepID=UPI002AAACC17|nr:chromosome partition protein MukE [uncultured Bacteroides sp.]